MTRSVHGQMFFAPKFFRVSADLLHGKCNTSVCTCVEGTSGGCVLLYMYGDTMCIYSLFCVCVCACACPVCSRYILVCWEWFLLEFSFCISRTSSAYQNKSGCCCQVKCLFQHRAHNLCLPGCQGDDGKTCP